MDKARQKYGEHLALSWPVRAHYRNCRGNPLVVQLFGFTALTAEGAGSIRGWATKMPQGVWHSPKKKICHFSHIPHNQPGQEVTATPILARSRESDLSQITQSIDDGNVFQAQVWLTPNLALPTA